ncbi:DUF3011 domain-containing protein [Luteimonas huabeiensis]|uniref:DUF3011 domain-containing protein n=1 Tax=Luteimonas huabeiensis TaxID=1244513 RepID=UPI0004B58DAF|nr:DUF3011 domain-containing protein [Luteimonas huabeiensis]
MLRRAVIALVALACGGCGLTARLGLGERQPAADAPGEPRVFRCESRDNRRNYCPADTRRGVRLLQQNSSHPCVQGSTWSYDDRAVWVARGCSADFIEGPVDLAGRAPPQKVRCESRGTRTTRCNVVVADSVILTRQLSETRCVQRQNWGWDRGGIWVNGGCAAEFLAR